MTVCNVSIVASGETVGIALSHSRDANIDRVSITSPTQFGDGRLLVGIKDVYGDQQNVSITNSHISHTSTGIQIANGLIADNYIHDLGLKDGDHLNGTTSNAGTSQLTILHNTVFNSEGQTDAISLFQDFGNQHDAAIIGNLLAGGGYTIYGGANAGGQQTRHIRIEDNRISRMYFPRGGSYGWLAAVDSGASISGNVWDDTGAPIN